MHGVEIREGREDTLEHKITNGFVLRESAENWCEGTICGNGTIGAIVIGNPVREQIILSHEEWFVPAFGCEKPIEMAGHLGKIRQLIQEGKYRQAGHIPWELFQKKYHETGGKKLWTNPFMPVGDVVIETKVKTEHPKEYEDKEYITGYERSLNFETKEAVVSFETESVSYKRRAFISDVKNCMFVELSAVDLQSGEDRPCVYQISLEKHPNLNMSEESVYQGIFESLKVKTRVENNVMNYRCQYGNKENINKESNNEEIMDKEAGCEIRLEICGNIKKTEGIGNHTLVVHAAGNVLLKIYVEITKSSLEFLSKRAAEEYQEESLEIDTESVQETEKKECRTEYQNLLQESAEIHAEKMKRVCLQLEEIKFENDEELYQHARKSAADGAFLNRIFEAGKYAILSSNGKFPPNLQGIWTGTYEVPWSSDYTQDGNLQTAILGMLPCGDFEGMKSFIRYQESLIEHYRENSHILYGCRGIHVPTRTSDSGYDIHFDETWPMLFWTAGAGWNARFFYDYWLYTGDEKFFKKHTLPFMKEAALFYEDYLIEGEDGKWIFSPSYSPENTPQGNDSSVAINATMDISVAKELLTNLISGCRTLTLQEEEENIRKWESMLEKMPDYQINADGALKEWAWDSLEDEYDHRHLSHLYLLFYDIPEDVRKDNVLFEACRKAYEIKMERKKKEQGTMAFGLIQAGMVAAHLGDADMTEILLQSVARNNYYPTFASSHDYGPSIFNVDISGGMPALMLECVAQSFPILREDKSIDYFEIRLLPALPQSMKSGEVDGLYLRGGFRLYMKWKDGKIEEYRVENQNNQKYVILNFGWSHEQE